MTQLGLAKTALHCAGSIEEGSIIGRAGPGRAGPGRAGPGRAGPGQARQKWPQA